MAAVASESHMPVRVNGFTVVLLKSSADKAGHCLYLKEHAVREVDSSRPKNKTVFVINVPPYCNEDCLKQLFTPCGKVMKVFVQDKPTSTAPCGKGTHHFPAVANTTVGFKVAYIVFKNKSGVKNACSLSYSSPLLLSNLEKPIDTGVSKWCKMYAAQRVDIKELQSEIDEYMTKFDAKQQEELQKQKDQEGVADDEGWITVTKVGKNKGAPRTEARKHHLTKREMKRRKEKELLNFYAFQFKETKKDQITALRMKFEEDKKKIAMMKAHRKFRPY